MALLLSNGSFFRLTNDGKLLLSSDKSLIPDPLIPPITPDGAFNYQELLDEATSLINQFGLPVTFTRRTSTSDPATPWKKSDGPTLTYNGFAIKTQARDGFDTEPSEVTNTTLVKFLVSSNVEVKIGDSFRFHDAEFVVEKTRLVNPAGLVIYQEIIVK